MDRDEPSPDFSAFFGEDTADESSTDIIQGSLPESVGRVSEHLRSRRSFMGDALKVGAGAAALGAVGTGTVAAEGNGDSGNGSSSDVSDLDVLNYALTLEHLEATYYREFLNEYSEHDVERSEVAKYFARPTLRYSLYQQIEDVAGHEKQHVDVLTKTIKSLGGTPVEEAEYEFPYDSLDGFIALADRLEAVGTSAYAGAAPLISNPDLIPPALSIHSVEANHWTFFNFLDLRRAAPNAFNPARTMDEVLGIAKPLISGQGGGGQMQTFSVSVENVSKPGTLDTDRAMGAVPLSPGAYAAYTGSNPMFTVGQQANTGTERIAEDGFPGGALPPDSDGLADMVANADNVTDSGTFASPGGSLPTPALGPGESAEFTVMASEGESLQFETMFVQSNDWFYAFEGDGLELFPGSGAVSGDVTGHVALYDAGTEADTPPGTGSNQKPVQDPMATNVGPNDSVNKVELASNRHPDYDIPNTGDVIKMTITPQ